MPTKVIMPQLGESVEEGTVSKWLKSPGEQVDEFEALLEVNTDKVDTEIPSPASGILLVAIAEEGQIVSVGTILGWIGQEGEEIPSGEDDEEKSIKELDSPADTASPQEEVVAQYELIDSQTDQINPGRHPLFGFISPLVARIASENSVNLQSISGTGLNGRITKNDIVSYLNEIPPTTRVKHKSPPAGPSSATIETGTVVPLTPVRLAIADHMVHSKHTSPHVTTVMEVDLSHVVAHRTTHKEEYARDNIKLTFTPYFISATTSALKAYPLVNSSWSQDGIRIHQDINIGMATSLGEEGLIVPVIKNADRLSLSGLARVVNDLADRARSKQLLPDEVAGGTFTITNHGTSGSLLATPIINQPQCGILGVGAIQKRVVVVSDNLNGDSIAIRPMVYLTLTFDHRILDGAVADYFLVKIVDSLKSWTV